MNQKSKYLVCKWCYWAQIFLPKEFGGISETINNMMLHYKHEHQRKKISIKEERI
jgi:hypothetical protein